MGLFDLFRKPAVRSAAEVLESGRDAMQRELAKARYNEYQGAEPMVPVRVRVEPEGGAPFEAVMQAGVLKAFLLLPGVRVFVKHRGTDVRLDDDEVAILARNGGILKRGDPA